MSVDKGFVPGVLLLILNLNDMDKSNGIVRLDEIFEGSREIVVRPS
jgi:hypothetical protein